LPSRRELSEVEQSELGSVCAEIAVNAAALSSCAGRLNIFTHRIRLFSLFGFDVWVDASWLLLAALIIWTLAEAVFPGLVPHLARAAYWWMAAATTIGLLFSIVFHETAHALLARHYGMPVRGITLFIFGGVAEMEQEPPSPKSELLMAIAGPLASFVLAGVFFVLLLLAGALDAPPAVQGTLWYMWFINAVLGIFNLIPAFPLDGGRVLRAALWLWRGDLVAATRIAAEAGNFFGILLMVFGVFGVITGDFIGGMWRFLIGLFLKGAADASYREVIARTALQGVLVAQVMTPDPISVTPETSVESFIEDFVYRYHHRVFPVTRDGAFLGCVGTEQAATIAREAWPTTLIAWIMQPCAAEDTISPGKDAIAALAQMRRAGRTRLWVVEGGRLVGVLSLRDMLELLSTKLELEGNGRASRGMLRKTG